MGNIRQPEDISFAVQLKKREIFSPPTNPQINDPTQKMTSPMPHIVKSSSACGNPAKNKTAPHNVMQRRIIIGVLLFIFASSQSVVLAESYSLLVFSFGFLIINYQFVCCQNHLLIIVSIYATNLVI